MPPPLDIAATVAQIRAQARALDALADAMEAGAVTDASPLLAAPTHHIDRAIVAALAGSRWPVKTPDLAARVDFSRRTLGPRLKILETAGTVCRPFGARGGWALSERSTSH